MKKCSKCGETKALSEFVKSSQSKDGYYVWCKSCQKIHMRNWRERKKSEDPDYLRRMHLRDYYGWSLESFSDVLEAQEFKCANPGCNATDPGPGGMWHVDHRHDFSRKDPKGRRALLCHYCNVGLGHFRDDPERLRGAAEYLEHWNKVIDERIKKEAS
jgi:protein-arginine kinase activator protein McsA